MLPEVLHGFLKDGAIFHSSASTRLCFAVRVGHVGLVGLQIPRQSFESWPGPGSPRGTSAIQRTLVHQRRDLRDLLAWDLRGETREGRG